MDYIVIVAKRQVVLWQGGRLSQARGRLSQSMGRLSQSRGRLSQSRGRLSQLETTCSDLPFCNTWVTPAKCWLRDDWE